MKYPTLKEYWLESGIYERFQLIIISFVSMIIAVIVSISVIRLLLTIGESALTGGDIFTYTFIRDLLGQILLILIALEFGHSLITAANDRRVVFQIRGIVLIGVLAVIRKLILIEVGEVDVMILFGLAATLIGLSALYWVVNRPLPETE